MTASGPDRPGIVSRLSKRVLELGGNVEESRMARLAGDFSILMLVTVDAT
jgi:glycine cleavage system transcriptional repressor